ncbi:uncharacterized protein LOC126419272 [Schistocerca serialis cubense]|uniref:uncharacterized protein LOC126419272 n=1 Tax=Schistocerca serialis cubense TaxID=2023355 RepID=UPI00214E2FD5|nr:uncharacterized protein LOC126419272 [Schistocerca serialis cubense]
MLSESALRRVAVCLCGTQVLDYAAVCLLVEKDMDTEISIYSRKVIKMFDRAKRVGIMANFLVMIAIALKCAKFLEIVTPVHIALLVYNTIELIVRVVVALVNGGPPEEVNLEEFLTFTMTSICG